MIANKNLFVCLFVLWERPKKGNEEKSTNPNLELCLENKSQSFEYNW